MIKLLRIDHRLLHGQVAMAWTQHLDVDCLLIANDALMNDEIKKTTIKLAKPNGVKLVMKNISDSIEALKSGATDKYKLFIVVGSIEDANRITLGYEAIKSINIGGCAPREETRKLAKSVPITKDEELMLKDMIKRGLELEIRQVPSDSKILIKDLL